MAILTSGYVDLMIGTAVRTALAPSSEVFAAHEAAARALVASAARPAGYTVGTASEDELIKLATLGQWYILAGGLRKGIEPPAAVKQAIDILTSIRKGELPPALSPSPRDGIGGTRASRQTGTGARAPKFSRDKLGSW